MIPSSAKLNGHLQKLSGLFENMELKWISEKRTATLLRLAIEENKNSLERKWKQIDDFTETIRETRDTLNKQYHPENPDSTV